MLFFKQKIGADKIRPEMPNWLQNIADNTHKLENRADDTAQMEDRMHPPAGFAKAVERCAYRVYNAACKNPQKRRSRHGGDGGLESDDHAPAHGQVKDHGELGILFEIDGRKHGGGNGTAPHDAKQHPRPACNKAGIKCVD